MKFAPIIMTVEYSDVKVSASENKTKLLNMCSEVVTVSDSDSAFETKRTSRLEMATPKAVILIDSQKNDDLSMVILTIGYLSRNVRKIPLEEVLNGPGNINDFDSF